MNQPIFQEQLRAAQRLSLALTEWFQYFWKKTQPTLEAWGPTIDRIMDFLYAKELNYPTGDEEWDVFI